METVSLPVSLSAAAGLVSATAAAVTLYLRTRTKERMKAMENASGELRLKLLADALVMFEIDARGLTTDQQYNLALKQLDDRSKQRQRQFFAFLFVTSVLAATTVTLALIQKGEGSTVIQHGDTNVNESAGASVTTRTEVLQTNANSDGSPGMTVKPEVHR